MAPRKRMAGLSVSQDLKSIDEEWLRSLVNTLVQQALEVEMSEALQAERGSGQRSVGAIARGTGVGPW